MKIAVINTFNAKDIGYWSGIPYHNSLMLDEMFNGNVHYITLPPLKRTAGSLVRGFYYNRLRHKRYYTWADETFVHANRRRVRRFLKEDYDLVLTYEFYLVPLLKTSGNKVVHWNDANFKNIHNYYDGYSNLSGYSARAAHALQKKALQLSDAVIYSSDWAVETAASFYHTNRKKLHKIAFASNFKTRLAESDVDAFIAGRKKKVVKLLFLGADWKRKGGDKAVEVVNALNSRGIESLLYIVGTEVPPYHGQNKNIVRFGFINKNSTDGEQKLVDLFRECTFLMLPSETDITPVAFSEANAFALPVVTTTVGGICSVVENNVSGHCFEPSLFIESSVTFILEHLPESNAYSRLCRSAYVHYRHNLSWEQVQRKFSAIVQELMMTEPVTENA